MVLSNPSVPYSLHALGPPRPNSHIGSPTLVLVSYRNKRNNLSGGHIIFLFFQHLPLSHNELIRHFELHVVFQYLSFFITQIIVHGVSHREWIVWPQHTNHSYPSRNHKGWRWSILRWKGSFKNTRINHDMLLPPKSYICQFNPIIAIPLCPTVDQPFRRKYSQFLESPSQVDYKLSVIVNDIHFTFKFP